MAALLEMKKPKCVEAYNALEKEFALASALIEAREAGDMMQEQVARLESGRTMPSTRTLALLPRLRRLSCGFDLSR
jgi:hypothetical protein